MSHSKLQKLFSPFQLTPKITLKHRIAMAPMTRVRCTWEGLPTELQPTFYQQRATDGGLLITEAMHVSEKARGYIRVPSLYTTQHSDAWKPTVAATKAKGAFLFAQIVHTGRAAHRSISGHQPVAPSAVALSGKTYTNNGLEEYEVPRALETSEVAQVVEEFANSAAHAINAGFDGVELHAGNGYLVHQFLATQTNQRTDRYGGSKENRSRFLFEVVDAIAQKIGAERLGVRLQPGPSFTQLSENAEDVTETYSYAFNELSKRKIGYLHVSNFPRLIAVSTQKQETDVFPFDVEVFARKHYQGSLIVNGALSADLAEEKLKNNIGDVAAFGTLFISNPDLVDRFYRGKELNLRCYEKEHWYGSDPSTDAKGYIDWPSAS